MLLSNHISHIKMFIYSSYAITSSTNMINALGFSLEGEISFSDKK